MTHSGPCFTQYTSEPKLIPGSSNFAVPEGVWIPETWLQVLSTDVLSERMILDIWNPLIKYIPNAVAKIAVSIMQTALAIYSHEETKVNLMYIFQASPRAENGIPEEEQNIVVGWAAGLPATDEDIVNAEAKLNIVIPESYKRFVRTHNGFNLYPLDAGPRSLNNLYFLSRFEYLDENYDYRPDKLLAFSGDGAGNEQCYNLMLPLDDKDYLTYDWDHETAELTKSITFWNYLEQFIMTELRDA